MVHGEFDRTGRWAGSAPEIRQEGRAAYRVVKRPDLGRCLTLGLTLGTPATFGPFTPGATQTYESSTTASVISTAGDATLSITDPSSVANGHLVNGAFSLPEPLQARASNAANTGTTYANVGSSASPLTLLTWNGPVSNDLVTLGFSQLIKATDALRTGTYNKTLTVTLSTTTP